MVDHCTLHVYIRALQLTKTQDTAFLQPVLKHVIKKRAVLNLHYPVVGLV